MKRLGFQEVYDIMENPDWLITKSRDTLCSGAQVNAELFRERSLNSRSLNSHNGPDSGPFDRHILHAYIMNV